MKKYSDVELTKPLDLFFLILFSISVLFVSIFVLKLYMQSIVSILIGFILTVFLFIKFKNRIIRKVNFIVYKDKIEYENKIIFYNDIESFKLNFISGVILKISLKNGKKVTINSNSNFCKSTKFEILCKDLQQRLLNYKDVKIIRKLSFLETKLGFYFIVIMSLLSIFAILFSIFTEKKMNFITFGIIISSLLTIWVAYFENNR